MIINGKCADRFKEWVNKAYPKEIFGGAVGWDNCYFDSEDILEKDNLPDSCKLGLIVEFMDSEGMYISPFYSSGRWSYAASWEVTRDLKRQSYPSRTEALKAAIEKGNDLFNTKNQ